MASSLLFVPLFAALVHISIAFDCQSDGIYSNTADAKCVRYWVCQGGVLEAGKCPGETMFYPNAGKCVEASELTCVGVPVMNKKLHRVRREKKSQGDDDEEHHEEKHHEDKSSSHSSSDESHKEYKEKLKSSSSDHKYQKHEKDHKDITSTSDHNTESDDTHIEYEKHYYHKEYFPVPIQTAAAGVIPGVLNGGFPFAGNMQARRGNAPARYQNQQHQQQQQVPPQQQDMQYEYYMPQYSDYDYGNYYGYQSNEVYQPRYDSGYRDSSVKEKPVIPKPQTPTKPEVLPSLPAQTPKKNETPRVDRPVFGQFGGANQRPREEPLRQAPSQKPAPGSRSQPVRPTTSFSNHAASGLAPYMSKEEDDAAAKPALHLFGLF